MEENQNQLFSLIIDPLIKSHLGETARWGKFLAILGFILSGLIIILGIFFGTVFSTIINQGGVPYNSNMNSRSFGAIMAIVYVIIAVIYFFPCLFLYRFSTKMKSALIGNEQTDLALSFQNLKSLFRYVGVITLIVLAIYLIIFLFAILGAAFIGR
jgi:hypothetical protein